MLQKISNTFQRPLHKVMVVNKQHIMGAENRLMSLLQELYQYREMITTLVYKDLRGRYKGSVLGFLWTFLNPLLQLAVYTMVFSVILRAGIEKYYLFLFVALIPWIFFSTCLTGGSAVILNEKNLVTKIYFPREVLPVSFVSGSFINMLYSFIVVLAVVFFSSGTLNLLAWCYLPIVMAVEYMFALGCTFLASSLTVYFRDLQHILGIISMAWQFLTPVMYSVDMVPEELLTLFYMNPMTTIIIAYRDILYYGKIPAMETIGLPFIISIVTLLLGVCVFHRLQRNFAEEL